MKPKSVGKLKSIQAETRHLKGKVLEFDPTAKLIYLSKSTQWDCHAFVIASTKIGTRSTYLSGVIWTGKSAEPSHMLELKAWQEAWETIQKQVFELLRN